jgi:hypothetical protein
MLKVKWLLLINSKKGIRLFFGLLIITGWLYMPGNLGLTTFPEKILAQTSGPVISAIATNGADYPGAQVPKYEKLELTFQVENTVAGNFQFPYDPNPPHGIDLSYAKHQGISVDALFLPPGQTDWGQAYPQPAFYFQQFDDQVRKDKNGEDRDWSYPTGEFSWKVRFAPNQAGQWQYRLKAIDASGSVLTAPAFFTVIDSAHNGFIRVSPTDPRYFEFDDGRLFNAQGFEYSSYLLPSKSQSEPDFQAYQQNHITLLRVWISSMYGAAWMHYLGGRNIYDGYLPRPGILPYHDDTGNRTTLALRLDYEPEGDTGWFDACRFRFWDNFEAVKPHTDYRLRIQYSGFGISGPRDAAHSNYGLVGKFGNWDANCYEPGTGNVITNYGLNSSDWQYIEGAWNSGNNNFLPRFHMGLENVTEGQAYVDSILVQENLGNGQYGPEIMIEPSMEYELYFSQRESYGLDKLIELADKYDIYLKLVLMDKNDKIYYKIDDNGDFVAGEDNLDGFYGAGRTLNKTRWLQQAWWRYLQARWGYSPHIHSWELTNEGDPWNTNHYALTDELGKYMHCRAFGVAVGAGDGKKCAYDPPNDHLVTTSFWNSFPGAQFWANPNYPNVDYADVHAYVSTGWQNDATHEADAAKFHLDYSSDVRSNIDWYAAQNHVPVKPIIRGETGIDFIGNQQENPDLALDTQGIWLHNFLWSTLDPGAMTELYWWGENIKNQPGPDGQPGLYEIYRNFSDFMKVVPLNNGHYQDVAAAVDVADLRVVGQSDLAHGRAHLWFQNAKHTWRNVVDEVSVPSITGTVVITGFQPGQTYTVEWWDTYQPNTALQILATTMITAKNDGGISLSVNNLYSDVAVKICPTIENGGSSSSAALPDSPFSFGLNQLASDSPPISVAANHSVYLPVIIGHARLPDSC